MIGERLRQARLIAMLTLDEVVEQLAKNHVALTKAGLSKYERGGSVPKAQLLLELARVLDTRTEYFLSEPKAVMNWLAFRKTTKLGLREQERIESLAENVVEAHVWLREKLKIKDGGRLPNIQVRNFQAAEDAAIKLRHSWKLDDSPVESVTESAEDQGVIVVLCDDAPASFHGLSGIANKTRSVVVETAQAEDDRRRFNVAHELGHLVMTCKTATDKEQEKFAHRFAAAFIVPAQVAIRELGRRRKHLGLEELSLLKKKHGLSMQAWAYRAADLDIIDRSRLHSLFIEMSARGWRKSEPVNFERHEEPTRLRQMTLRAVAEGIVSRDKAESLCPGCTKGLDEEPEAKRKRKWTAKELLQLTPEERDKVLEAGVPGVARDYGPKGVLRRFDAFDDEDMKDDHAK